MKAICDLMPFEEVCTGSPDSIRNTIHEKSKRVSKNRRYDSMYRAWNCFMKVWEDMNHYFSLNSGNLLGALEVMLAQLMFKFADTNETWYVISSSLFFSSFKIWQCLDPGSPPASLT